MKAPGGSFTQQCTLQGHSNWIRGLSAVHITEDSGKVSVLVASASQDRTARLWKVSETSSEAEQQGKDAENAVCQRIYSAVASIPRYSWPTTSILVLPSTSV